MELLNEITFSIAATKFLEGISQAYSANTTRTYANAISIFFRTLEEKGENPQTASITQLREDTILSMADYLKAFSPATEELYLHAVKSFYEYVAAEGLAGVNLSRLRILIGKAKRHHGPWAPEIPTLQLEQVLDFVTQISNLTTTADNGNEYLRALRDRAFLLTLADTGLRVYEACGLRRGDLDWNKARAAVIGKGKSQGVVRFTSRSIHALNEYLAVRTELDDHSEKPLTALPLFARHDKGAGRKVKPITTATGRNIVSERVRQALGDESEGHITPHSFRHYFVTTILRGSGNIKLAQELARHANIQVTQRYAHLSDDELDRGYHEIFERDTKMDEQE